ncbi:MAG TPA: DUF4232 domain-containing protein [Solirubrobacteraceae bacterium]|nr:DUF4232 domain-containing protein [Solirubrobacteraceae bacterium]
MRNVPGRRSATIVGVLAVAASVPGIGQARVLTPACSARHLGAWAGSTTGAAGHFLSEFAFVNRGARACSLTGSPRVAMLDSRGRPIRTTDHASPSGALGIERKVVVLAKGQRAYFGVYYANKTGFGNLVCPTAAKLRLTLPGRHDRITLSGKGAHIAPYGGASNPRCGGIEVTPVTAKRFQ